MLKCASAGGEEYLAGASLSELADRLSQALQTTPDSFVSRAEVAKRIGKKQLSAREVAALDFLVEVGRAEVQKVPDPRPIGYRFEYKHKK